MQVVRRAFRNYPSATSLLFLLDVLRLSLRLNFRSWSRWDMHLGWSVLTVNHDMQHSPLPWQWLAFLAR